MKAVITRAAALLAGVLLTSFCYAQTGNFFSGPAAGANNTTGSYNSFIGYLAGYSNTTGWNNSFIGSNAGYSNTGSYSTFVGAFAGYANTSGLSNAFFGYSAGTNNTTASSNSFFGHLTGYSNTTGQRNSHFGSAAGRDNITGSDNVFIGSRAGLKNTVSNNTFVGAQAGENNTTGILNTFIGRSAGFANTTGGNNTFLGFLAGSATTTGANNVFVGSVAGDNNINGGSNTFVGRHAGGANTSGSRNSFLGYLAGESNTSGYDNTFLGREAGRHNTTGTGNTSIGNYAQQSNGTLTNSTAIGNKAIVKASNSMVLGSINGENGATVTVKVGVGTAAPGYNLHVNGTAAKPGGGSWIAASDRRLKRDITPFTEGLQTITKVNPVWFRYNGKAGLPTNQRFVGVIAQDMQKIAPHTIGEFTYENEGQTEKYLDYDANALTYTLVNAVKELNVLVQQQTEEIKKLKEQLASLKGEPVERSMDSPVAKLWQNSPNPYASSTIIKYYVPEDVTDAQIQVISMSGQEVYSRHLTEKGESQIEISHQMLSAGTYVYQLSVNGTIVDKKKMVVSK